MLTVTGTDTPRTRAPAASAISICGCRVNGSPLTAPPGCTEILRARAAVAATSNDVLETVRSVPPAVKRRTCAPVPLMARFANVATPATAFTVDGPTSVPVPDATATFMGSELAGPLVIVAPVASTMRTTGCGSRGAPDTALVGAVMTRNPLAALPTTNDTDATSGRPGARKLMT